MVLPNKPIKISQSAMKSIADVNNGKECGLVYKAKFIDGRYDLFPPSDAQNAGAWFEYMATGSIPKNGIAPKPEYMKRGKDDSGNPELTAPYRLMKKHVENFKKTINAYGFDIVRVGEDIVANYPDSLNKFGFNVLLTGTLDIRAIATKDIYSYYGTKEYGYQKVMVAKKGQVCIIDLKTTGLLDDKWNDYGWEINNLHNKNKLITQPIHYKYIEKLNSGEEPPFIFMLYSQSNEFDTRIIDFRVDESIFDVHEKNIESSVILLHKYLTNGFPPIPDIKRCSECPLRNDCAYKEQVPKITVFYLSNEG